MHTSEDASDEGSWKRDYGQPFDIPSPKNDDGGLSNHEPHIIKDDKVDNEEVEDFHPVFDYGGAKKEEQLQRQTRRMTTDRLLEEAETFKTQRVKETVVQWSRTVRQLVDEEGTESHEAIDTKEAEEDSRQRKENKRKGKERVVSLKKSRPDNERAVSPLPEGREEDSNEEECELRWTRTSRKQQEVTGTPPSTTFSFRHVVLTTALLQKMLEFDDPKCKKRFIKG